MALTPRRTAGVAFLVAATLLVAVSGALVARLTMLGTTERGWVDHTHAVVEVLNEVLLGVTEGETAVRGFLLGRDEAYLGPYTRAAEVVPVRLARLGRLVADNPLQTRRAAALGEAVARRFAVMRGSLDAAREGASGEAIAASRGAEALRAMAAVRAGAEVMTNEEHALLGDRDRRAEATAYYASGFAVGSLVLSLVALFAAWGLVEVETRDRGAVERRLREEGVRRQVILDNIDQGLVMTGPDGSPSLLNARAAALLGLPPGSTDIAGNPADPTALRGLLGAAGLLPEEPLTVRDGPGGSILEVASRDLGEEGAVRTYADVTARHLAEGRLRVSEARYRLLAQNATDIIARVTLDGTILYLSPAVEAVLGRPAEDFAGTRATDHIHPRDAPLVRRTLRDLVRAGPGARAEVEYRVRHADGRWVWLQARPGVASREDGGPAEIVDVVRDVTQRKILDADLLAARAAAERAAAVQADFLASMSHEIRTPLNGILGTIDELLDDGRLDGGQRRSAERIQVSGAALLTIVDDVLDFSKLDAGAVTYAALPFRIGALAEGAASIVRGIAEAKGLELTVEIDPALPAWVVGDEARLRQVLLNFLNNAVKFTREGAVTLAVTREGSGDTVRFAVRDTGVGVSPEKLGRLFKRFSQVDGSVSREFGGTGLGLAIAKRLAEGMGGSVGVESAPGRGSTFRVELALPAGEAPAAAPAVPAAGEGRRLRLLLAEDVEINRDIARGVLERAGHRVDAVVDGMEAVLAVELGAYDLVLMDIQMPGMDGITATRRIRALGCAGGSVPILAMTANVLPTQVASFLEAGMDGHVGKPFKREELLAKVATHARGTAPTPCAIAAVPSAATHDAEAFAALAEALGAEKAGSLLDRLRGRVEGALTASPEAQAGRTALAREAHALASTAGALGFPALADACRTLEAAVDEGAPVTPALDAARTAARDALAAIAGLRGREGLRAG